MPTKRRDPQEIADDSIGLLCKIRTAGIPAGSRAGEMKLVDAVYDRDGGIEYDGGRWVQGSDDEFWTIVDSKFCGGVYWYKVASSKGETGWTNQGWRLQPVEGEWSDGS